MHFAKDAACEVLPHRIEVRRYPMVRAYVLDRALGDGPRIADEPRLYQLPHDVHTVVREIHARSNRLEFFFAVVAFAVTDDGEEVQLGYREDQDICCYYVNPTLYTESELNAHFEEDERTKRDLRNRMQRTKATHMLLPAFQEMPSPWSLRKFLPYREGERNAYNMIVRV